MEAMISDETISQLNQLQQRLLRAQIPVLIVFEGSSGRIIGRVINELIRCLEPRGIEYHDFAPKDVIDPSVALDFLQQTPGKGRIGLYDRSWYSAIIERYGEDEKKKELDRMLRMCNDFERYLVRNGVFLIKIILKASESVVKEYGDDYWPEGSKHSFLSMDKIDRSKYREVMFDHIFEETNTDDCPWDLIVAGEVEPTVNKTIDSIIQRLEQRLTSEPSFIPQKMEHIYENPRVDLNLCEKCKKYSDTIGKLSEELSELQMDLSVSDRSVIICFEGWDASGKGSSIKHLCHGLNPRGYVVNQTKAPTEAELSHTYLWRFCENMPHNGHISIFDRTWYGRMMVEHIEGLCTDDEYERSAHEINTFERIMVNNGGIVIKFWMDITPEEQLCRFNDRMNDPLKQWKITDEDWRNREKWDQYDEHVNAMMESTNTEHAPWTVVESVSKKYARIKVIQTVVDVLKKELKH